MLHIKFQAPEPSSSGEEDFLSIHVIYFRSQVPAPQGHFRSKGYHSNKLGRGPLDNNSDQVSKR